MNTTLLRRLFDVADAKTIIADVLIYLNWVLVKTNDYAMSTLLSGMPGLIPPEGMNTFMGDILGRNGLDVAMEFLDSKETLKRAVGMACLKGLLPKISAYEDGNAIDRHREFAREHPTVFIGHFAEAETWRSQGNPVDIVELFPRPGDIHWDDSHDVLAKAELVLMTGLTLVNDTFDEVVKRSPRAKYRVVMGPTVPISSVLFDFGVDQIGGTIITDPQKTIRYCSLGGGSIAHAPPGALQKINVVKP
jgi:uncharacterized protein (DUF4213/DUF364 family)